MSICDEGLGCPAYHKLEYQQAAISDPNWVHTYRICALRHKTFETEDGKPDTCPYAPILKLLASAKEVSPDIEITFNNYENADDGEVVHFVIRR